MQSNAADEDSHSLYYSLGVLLDKKTRLFSYSGTNSTKEETNFSVTEKRNIFVTLHNLFIYLFTNHKECIDFNNFYCYKNKAT